MTRHIVLGNQSLLVNIDKWFQVRDIYFPHVGQENHLLGHAQRIGVHVDGKLSWVNEDGWDRKPAYKNDTLVTESTAKNKTLGIELTLEENVYCEANIFLRKITVKNTSGKERAIKLFFNHEFHLYGDGIGDTAVYQMDRNVIIHYKRSRYFLIGALKSDGKAGVASDMDDYSIVKSQGNPFKDIADGILLKNLVVQGSVDSTASVHLAVPAGSKSTVYYYMACGTSFEEVYDLNDMVMSEGPGKLLDHTEKCQRSWVDKTTVDLSELDPKLAILFKRSLLIIKTQTDKNGAFTAANDSDNTQFNKDTYSYMWPRDGALIAIALINAGFPEITKPFFEFCKDVIHKEGCLLHKYNPDRTLGSSWHPWVEHGKPSLPIQEDETALVIWALWRYYEATGDVDFIKRMYTPFVKKAASFMNKYRYPNELPKESYDLWEERRGIFTFTSSAVYAGLVAAEHLGSVFKDKKTCEMCQGRHDKLKQAIIGELFDDKEGRFLRSVRYEGGDLRKKISDATTDSSAYALFEFEVLPPDDPKVEATMEDIEKKLWVKSGKGGVARYIGDAYYRKTDKAPGNPWLICTLWLAKWYIAKAKGKKDMKRALELINWVANCSLETGIMPEQVHPLTGEPQSVAPLTWSHAEFVDTITKYVNKRARLG